MAARLPIVHQHVALMPDVHLGKGATIGSVIPTRGAIIPAAVGVDIGCGMAATRLPITTEQLPDSLEPLLGPLASAIPAGVGKGHEPSYHRTAGDRWMAEHPAPTRLSQKDASDAHRQFGSLGAGNHFFEVCADEHEHVWLLLHSGSRGIGNRLAQRWITVAKGLEFPHPLEDRDLAYFTEGTPEFQGYIADMLWSQEYAAGNRRAMLLAAADTMVHHLGALQTAEGERWRMSLSRRGAVTATEPPVINCHHNYAARETHDGVDLWVTRKGAIRAGILDLGLIPGSMGDRSFVVQGLGNALSWESCAHGAGRVLSRSAARRELSIESFTARMGDRTWQHDSAKELLDEHPDSYKPIEQVMADQRDLVRVRHELHQLLSYKGVS